MEVVAARVAVWVFTAFWFWLVLARILSRLRVPYAAIIAAVLGWIGAGLVAAWVLPPQVS
jgi:hypothetical protein